MNGYIWYVRFVTPNSEYLIDRTNTLRLATTDSKERTIFLSNVLSGDLLRRVLKHELGHVTMISYNLLPQIHYFAKQAYWIDAEEWICNFIADYSGEVLSIVKDILG